METTKDMSSVEIDRWLLFVLVSPRDYGLVVDSQCLSTSRGQLSKFPQRQEASEKSG